MTARIGAFFEEEPFTVSYLVRDAAGSDAAIVDSAPDFGSKSGRAATGSA